MTPGPMPPALSWLVSSAFLQPALKLGAVPVQGGDAGAELLDAADVEFDGAVVTDEAAGAVEEGDDCAEEVAALSTCSRSG